MQGHAPAATTANGAQPQQAANGAPGDVEALPPEFMEGKGLSDDEVAKMREKYGANEVTTKQVPEWKKIAKRYFNFISLVIVCSHPLAPPRPPPPAYTQIHTRKQAHIHRIQHLHCRAAAQHAPCSLLLMASLSDGPPISCRMWCQFAWAWDQACIYYLCQQVCGAPGSRSGS